MLVKNERIHSGPRTRLLPGPVKYLFCLQIKKFLLKAAPHRAPSTLRMFPPLFLTNLPPPPPTTFSLTLWPRGKAS